MSGVVPSKGPCSERASRTSWVPRFVARSGCISEGHLPALRLPPPSTEPCPGAEGQVRGSVVVGRTPPNPFIRWFRMGEKGILAFIAFKFHFSLSINHFRRFSLRRCQFHFDSNIFGNEKRSRNFRGFLDCWLESIYQIQVVPNSRLRLSAGVSKCFLGTQHQKLFTGVSSGAGKAP